MDSFYNANIVYQYFYLMVTGAHLGPLWFIPMMIIFNLLFPLLNFFNKKSSFYTLLIVTTLIGALVGRPELNSNVLQSFVHFLPAYIWGMWLHKNQKLIGLTKDKSICFFTAAVCLCLFFYYIFGYNTHTDLVLKMFLYASLFTLFAKYFNKKYDLLSKLAQISFFIFFIHGYFTGVLRLLTTKGYIDFSPLVAMVINFSVVMLCSLCAYYVSTLCLPKNKMYILGVSKG